jgi:hypothetical protein
VFVVEALCDTIRRDATMVTSPDIEAQIRRLYHAEKWTIGTIARQLHVYNGVVRRVLAQAGLPKIGRSPIPFSRICTPSATRVSGIDTPSKSAACATDKLATMTTAKINPRTMATRFYLHRRVDPTTRYVNDR